MFKWWRLQSPVCKPKKENVSTFISVIHCITSSQTFVLLDHCCCKPSVTDGAPIKTPFWEYREFHPISMPQQLLSASAGKHQLTEGCCCQSQPAWQPVYHIYSCEKLARVIHCGTVCSGQAWTGKACVSWPVYQSLSHLNTVPYLYQLGSYWMILHLTTYTQCQSSATPK